MIEVNFVGLWFLFVGVVFTFVVGLLISQKLNSQRLFHSICISFSLCMLCLPSFLKSHSPWHLANIHVLFISAIVSLLFVLKFLEWGFARDWNELRIMTIKEVAMDCSSYPKSGLSADKELSLNNKEIYTGNIKMFFTAVCQYLVLQTIMRATPESWVSSPMWSITPWIWPARYLLLSFVLYLCISVISNIVFSISGLIWGKPMNSTFPAFPFASCTIREFWSRRWNIFIKQLLQRTSFVVLPRCLGKSQTMSNTVRGLMSFVVSGIFHELLLTMCTDRWWGTNMIFFLMHAGFVTMEIIWERMNKITQRKNTFIGWLRTIGIFVATSPLFFDPWIKSGYFLSLKNKFS